MDCYNNPDKLLHEYCEECKVLVNFTYELYLVFEDYINNGGNIDDLEALSVDIYLYLFREACKNWCLNIDNIDQKQVLAQHNSHDLFKFIYNLPKDKKERLLFIEQQSGYAVIQISKKPWFQKVYNNVIQSIKIEKD